MYVLLRTSEAATLHVRHAGCDARELATHKLCGAANKSIVAGRVSPSCRRGRYLALVSGMLTVMHEEMSHPLLGMLRKLRPDKQKVRERQPLAEHMCSIWEVSAMKANA
jgi:hypothetical protein